MIDLFQVANQLQDFLWQQRWNFCYIGGIALQRWGEPRVTQDIDLTLLTGFGNEKIFIEKLLYQYQPRIDKAEEFALKNRVLLLQSESGIGIDIALGGLDFEALVIKRASDFEFLPGIKLHTCSAEDLIVLKSFADRNRDWLDVEGITIRQGEIIDWVYIFKELSPLCELKESPHIIERLKKLRACL